MVEPVSDGIRQNFCVEWPFTQSLRVNCIPIVEHVQFGQQTMHMLLSRKCRRKKS